MEIRITEKEIEIKEATIKDIKIATVILAIQLIDKDVDMDGLCEAIKNTKVLVKVMGCDIATEVIAASLMGKNEKENLKNAFDAFFGKGGLKNGSD